MLLNPMLELAMQADILKFLLEAQNHLRGGVNGKSDASSVVDLQAVERSLPDPDWFELDERRPTLAAAAAGLWSEGNPHLQF